MNEQNPLEKFFIFIIYQNYTLALKHMFVHSVISNASMLGEVEW